MNITLPENFKYKDIAEVKNKTLYIYKLYSFHTLMYEIKYATEKDLYCKYCRRKLTRNSSTIDHIYPVFIGGPFIPQNFQITCSKCNSLKDSMLEEDFIEYLSLSKNEKMLYKANYRRDKLRILLSKAPAIPENWFYYEKIDKINMSHESNITKGLRKPRTFYSKYKRIKNPIIVDKNYQILDGVCSFLVAKENNLEKVPVIVLENVVLST